MPYTLNVNGKSMTVDVAADMPAAVGVARRAQPEGHEVRLRHRAVRRLHGAPARRAGAVVPDAGVRRGGGADQDDRRALGRRLASAAARVDGNRRAAVRLLPGGADHVGRGAPRAQAEGHRRGHRSGDERNICRCATYLRIRQAIHRAAALSTTPTSTEPARGELARPSSGRAASKPRQSTGTKF